MEKFEGFDGILCFVDGLKTGIFGWACPHVLFALSIVDGIDLLEFHFDVLDEAELFFISFGIFLSSLMVPLASQVDVGFAGLVIFDADHTYGKLWP